MLQAFNFKPFGKLQCTWPAHTCLSSKVFGAGFPWLFVAGNFFCFLSQHMQPWQHKPNLVVHNILHHSLKLLLFFLECHSRFALDLCRMQCADRNSVLPYTLIWFGLWVEQSMGRGLAAPSNQVVHTHFAISENVGDVLAKEEVWTVAAELCGLALGVCILVKSVLQLFSLFWKILSTYEDRIALCTQLIKVLGWFQDGILTHGVRFAGSTRTDDILETGINMGCAQDCTPLHTIRVFGNITLIHCELHYANNKLLEFFCTLSCSFTCYHD